MTNEELVKANEALATLLRETLTELEKVKAERDAAATSAQALAQKLAGEKRVMSSGDRVYVSVMSESDLHNTWHQLSDDYEPFYQDNGPSNPKQRWQFEIWDWNGKAHIAAFAPSQEVLKQWEPALLSAYRAGMYSLWRYMEKRVWGD